MDDQATLSEDDITQSKLDLAKKLASTINAVIACAVRLQANGQVFDARQSATRKVLASTFWRTQEREILLALVLLVRGDGIQQVLIQLLPRLLLMSFVISAVPLLLANHYPVTHSRHMIHLEAFRK